MQTYIKQNEITFEFLTYKIIIPNNSNIEYYFEGLVAKITGDLPYFSVRSNDKKIVSKFYGLGYIIYYFSIFYRKILPLISDYSDKFIDLSTIYGYKKITNFLTELNNNRYLRINEQIQIIEKFKNENNN